MGRTRYLNADNIIKMCRVCLTRSNNKMFELTEYMNIDNSKIIILVALEQVASVKVLIKEDLPQYICPVCISMLKITYKFVKQFNEAQETLSKKVGKDCTSYELYKNDVKFENDEVENLNFKETSAPVEIIFGETKYDLKDVIVVEEAKPEENSFSGFLNKLGQEVSATFTNHQSHVKPAEEKHDMVSIFMKDDKNCILPVKELQIDDDTNTIEIIIVEEPNTCVASDANVTDNEEGGDLSDDMDSVNLESFNNDIESFISLQEDSQSATDTNRENYKESSLNMQEIIDSLIIENTGGSNEMSKESDSGDHSKKKNLAKVRKKRKSIEEKKINDIILMGPSVNKLQKEPNEDDIFEKEIKFPCELCKKVFATPKALRAHKRRTHAPKLRVFTCEICGHQNNTRSAYNHHKNKHTGKKFKCQLCKKMYYTKAVLKVHMETHTNKRQHLCNVCGKGFNYGNALVYHMRLHTNERNYKCKFCGDTFRMPNALKRHMCIHTGEKPYKCKFCDRGFCSRGEMLCHENIHTGYRPYHCKHCLKGFTKTHNLKLHLLSHPGPHECDICGRNFIEMAILSMHYKISHKYFTKEDDEDEDKESS